MVINLLEGNSLHKLRVHLKRPIHMKTVKTSFRDDNRFSKLISRIGCYQMYCLSHTCW